MLEELRESEAKGKVIDACFVPRPEEGFPTIHRANPTGNLDNVSGQTYEEWIVEDQNPVIAIAHFHNLWMKGKSTVVASLVKGAVKSYLNTDSVFIAHANPATSVSDEGAAPHAFAILNMSPPLAAALIYQGCLANDDIAVNFYSTEYRSPTTYLGYIEGLSNLEEPFALDKLKVFLRATFIHSPELNDAILDHIRDTRSDDDDVLMEADQRFAMENGRLNGIISNLVLKVVPIKLKDGKHAPAVNMYIPTIGQVGTKRWERILGAVKSLNFTTSLFGSGIYGRGFRCIGCRGMDHPAGMCPFRDLEGWHEICGINSDTLDAYRARIFKDLPTSQTSTAPVTERPSAQAKYAQESRLNRDTPMKPRGGWKGRGGPGRGRA